MHFLICLKTEPLFEQFSFKLSIFLRNFSKIIQTAPDFVSSFEKYRVFDLTKDVLDFKVNKSPCELLLTYVTQPDKSIR